MPYYEIKITPLQYYFFGGEKHDENLQTGYFVESLDYPQQTSILGMLRYVLLLKAGLLGGKNIAPDKQARAAELIGKESFQYSANQSFGNIKHISPLYFIYNGQPHYFAPLDYAFDLDDKFMLSYNGEAYNSKKHGSDITTALLDLAGKKTAISDIIGDIHQVGNEKAENGETREDAYYKQKMKKLKNGWSFGVRAMIDEELDNYSVNIAFGGEKSMFNISFKLTDKEFSVPMPVNYNRKAHLLICNSDCFVDGGSIRELPFAVTEYVSFRNLRSTTSTKNYYAFRKDQDINQGMKRSSRFQLLKRGSVLYFESEAKREAFAEKLETAPERTIGFNHISKN